MGSEAYSGLNQFHVRLSTLKHVNFLVLRINQRGAFWSSSADATVGPKLTLVTVQLD
jgi:hypothetical protein